ncbi:hypothetical protein HPP92_026346 [Vanilla planifolia]|uniref:Uncharacterized protein n=1 Tax=Vanilla planifolia TaxID=51239 RepID=A0A835PCJ9_VANPL|nr:hypothetical protein HPP92_026346 [Vanilla planifolia]
MEGLIPLVIHAFKKAFVNARTEAYPMIQRRREQQDANDGVGGERRPSHHRRTRSEFPFGGDGICLMLA